MCRDGTQSVPDGYVACCDVFLAHTKACVYDVRYEYWPAPGWFIAVAEAAGGGGVEISYCPHCSRSLP